MLKARPVSFPGMASTGRASGQTFSVPFALVAISGNADESEATAAGKNRKASRPRLTCCSIRLPAATEIEALRTGQRTSALVGSNGLPDGLS